MQAIILAGGFGTRLRSVVGDVPKPMAGISDEPFLAVLLRYAHAQGVRDVVLCLHHQAELIQDYFGARFEGMSIRYSVEEKPLGTGGAVMRALAMVDQAQSVLVMNGDSLVMLNYRQMLEQHQTFLSPITIASVEMPTTERYSRLSTQGQLITSYEVVGDAHAGDISVGFYVMQPNVFDGYGMPEMFSLERDFLAVHTPRLKPTIFTRVEYFIDIGVPADYARAQAELPRKLETHAA